MTPVTCTINTGGTIRVSPALPAGLKYSVESVTGGQRVTISGTAKEAIAPRNFYIGYNLWMAVVTISVFGTPTSCTYGFDSMTLYTDIPMEPIPIRCDTAITSYSINPNLPEGMEINTSTGVISGTLKNAGSSAIVYTVTATNPQGSVTTTFSFDARDNSEMTQAGMTGCYWSEITECLTPDFSFFYSKPAQICQIVSNLQFTDNYDYQSWPGLDSRFVDYFAAYFYGYVIITSPGTYQFAMNADDGAILYIDDVANPVIDVPGCWDTTASESTYTKTMTRGRHLVIIRYFEYNDGATVYLKMGSTDLNIPMAVITSNQLRVGGRGPTFISYNFVGGYAGTSLPVSRPELNSGAPHTWSISTLPQGLAFNTQNGYISGIPAAASSGVYTVTATGVNGVASTTVRIVITQSPIHGFLAHYYKIMDSNFCVYPALKGNVVSLKSIQVDSQVNHPKASATYLWPDTPQDFTTYFYVEWEGYLYMEGVGNWKLKLTCSSGCKLYGADDQLLIANWGCHGYTGVEATYPVSSNGYYYFRIEYAQKNSEKGIVFEWQAPTGSLEVVPEDKIYHIPTGVLSYKYELSHYYRGVQIEDNSPVAFSVSSLTNFQIYPPLPAGLVMNSNGVISGTPTQEQLTAYYTITAQASTGTETTVIGFDIQYVTPPSSISIVYNGQVVSNVNLVPLVTMSPITITVPTGVTINEYTIHPTLPEGLSFNPSTGSITGKPLVSSQATTYTISAFNAGGSAFASFQLTISGCTGTYNGQQFSNSFYLLYLSTGSATFDVKLNDATIQCAVDNMNSDGTASMTSCTKTLSAGQQAVFCVPPNANNKIHVSCTDRYGCYWQIRREDGNRFPTRLEYHETNPPPYINTYDFPNGLTPLTSLTVTPSEAQAVSGYPMSTVTITPNGCFKSITVNPAIAGYSTIPLMQPRLSGVIYGRGTNTYTVTATGDAGTATATFTLNFVECDTDSTMTVTFTKTTTTYGTEEGYSVYNSAGDELLSVSGLGNYMQYENVLCMEAGTYKIVMKDTYGDGWSTGATLRVTDNEGSIIQEYDKTHFSTGKEKEVSLVVSIVIAESTLWKGMIGKQPGRNWQSRDFDHSNWADYTSGVVGQWSTNTVYFVHRFNIDDMKMYPVIEFGIYYKDAIVVYLNGAQVYSRNIGSSFSHNTQAHSAYDDYYMRVGSAPGYKLLDGENVLAVEMHRHSSTSGDIYWKGYVKMNQGTCITRIDSGYITESSHYNKDTETAAQAWDRNTVTQWVEGGLPAWTIYSYNFDRMEWVNKLVIGSNINSPDLDPTVVKVFGSLDGVSWDLITTISKKSMFTARKEVKEFMMLDHLNSYEKYKVELTESASDTAKVAISYLDLMACRLVYCTKDGDWPGTLAGESVTIDCAEGYIGERYRSCSNAEVNPSWLEADERECRSTNPPKNTAYIDFVIVISKVSVEQMFSGASATLATVISSQAGVQEKEVEVWKVKDVTETFQNPSMDDNDIKTAVYVRITISTEQASAVLTKMTNGLSDIQKSLNEYYADVFGESVCQYSVMPMLNEPKNLNAVSVTLIVVLVLVVIVLIVIFSFYLWVRLKNKGKKNGAKQLRSGIHKGEQKKAEQKKTSAV